MSTRILAHDPGPDNFGWALIEIKGKKTFRVERCGMLPRRIKKLVGEELLSDVARYKRRMKRLIRNANPDHMVAERYVPRRQGLANESVNLMLGIVLGEASDLGLPTDIFLAATWKLRVKKFMDLDAMYALFPRLPDHEIDACFMGLYLAEKKYGFDLSVFSNLAVRKRLGNQMMKVSQVIKPPKRVAKKVAAKKTKPKAKK